MMNILRIIWSNYQLMCEVSNFETTTTNIQKKDNKNQDSTKTRHRRKDRKQKKK